MRRISMFIFLILIWSCCIITNAKAESVFSPLNIAGDTIFLPQSGTFTVGAGTKLMTFYEFVEVRGELVAGSNASNPKIGLGVGVDVTKLLMKAKGTWSVPGINPAIGIMGLVDVKNKIQAVPAIYLTIVKVDL